MLLAKWEVFGKNKWTIIILKGYGKYNPNAKISSSKFGKCKLK